jgi:hypothetical protein
VGGKKKIKTKQVINYLVSSGSGFFGRFPQTCVSGKAGGHGLFTGIRARMRWSQVRGPIPVKKPSTEELSQRSASVFKFYNFFFPSIPPRKQKPKKIKL